VNLDRPIRLPWWRGKLWLRLGAAATAAVLIAAVCRAFPGDRGTQHPGCSRRGSLWRAFRRVYFMTSSRCAGSGAAGIRSTSMRSRADASNRLLVQAGDTVTAGQPLVEAEQH